MPLVRLCRASCAAAAVDNAGCSTPGCSTSLVGGCSPNEKLNPGDDDKVLRLGVRCPGQDNAILPDPPFGEVASPTTAPADFPPFRAPPRAFAVRSHSPRRAKRLLQPEVSRACCKHLRATTAHALAARVPSGRRSAPHPHPPRRGRRLLPPGRRPVNAEGWSRWPRPRGCGRRRRRSGAAASAAGGHGPRLRGRGSTTPRR